MTGYELPFLVLLAMYLLECIAWVPGGGVAFRACARRPWRPAAVLLGPLRGRWTLIVAGWLPAGGGVAVAEADAPALAPAGLCACDGDADPRGALRYEDLHHLEVDGVVVLSGARVVARAGSHRHARHLRRLLERLREAPPAAREALIRAEHERLLDPRAARRRVARLAVCARPLRALARALAAALFVALPLVLLAGGPLLAAPVLLAAVVLAWITTWTYRRLLRRAGGEGPIGERVITMALMPPAAIRADDFLARDLFGGLHWLPLARAACDPAAARAMAAGALRRVRHLTDPEREGCCAAGEWAAREWRHRLERWIETELAPPAGLLGTPAPETAACVAYCPRCLQQFTAARGGCPDCPGVPLETLVAA